MISRKFIVKKITKLLLHSIFWTTVLFSYTYFFGYNSENINYVFSFSLFLMPVTMGTTYVVTDFLIPKYLFQEKYALFVLYCVYTIIISAFFIIISFFYGLLFLTNINVGEMAPLTRSPLFLFVAVYFVVFTASALSLAQHNYQSITANQILKNRILEAQLKLKEQELRHLKMQIHPHFLFNTLNTIYGFAIKKSDQTPEMILRLSNLLDYLLYQVDKPNVMLKEEINHIKDYITLEKMRFRDTLDILANFKVSSDIKVAPMLLIPLVENSFKHGQMVDGKVKIQMELTSNENTISFYIKNSIKSISKNKEKGIGLSNIKKRLQLLYPGKHELLISENEYFFDVQLQLNTLKS